MKVQKYPHSHSIDEIYQSLNTSGDGLSCDEVDRRRKKYGRNRLKEQGKKSLFSIFLSQVNNPVIYLLLAAMTVSFIFSDIPEAIAIIIVILLNTLIGFWMEYRAQASLDALKKMDPLTTHVIREGEEEETNAEELVPGDLIHLEAGDLVPADARIVTVSELSVDESPLTGESLPVDKQADPLDESTQVADRTNMLFKGTAVTTGRTQAVVTATGMETEIGNISRMVGEAGEDEIPLNKKLGLLARRLIWVICGLAVLFFIFGWIAGKEIYLLLQTAIAWTVAAIPEGLPIVATISLARGMLRLAERNVVVRNLSSVETLGETTMILTDKTGTITKNQLTVESLVLVSQAKEEDSKAEAYRHFYQIAVLCNDAGRDNGNFQGDPLDVALLDYGYEQDEEKYEQLRDLKRINEDPFDSDSMMMGTIHEMEDSCYISAKGATQAILEICTHYFDGQKKKTVDDGFREQWIRKDRDLSSRGLKVIGFAFREEPHDARDDWKEKESFLEEMTFVGIAGFIDPVREDIADSLELCHHSGIKIVMVTGDHPETAMNIAREVNLVQDGKAGLLHGKDMKDGVNLSEARVFARVDPSQKLDIVDYFQQQGEIVGMTGDGVNDAPALKKADIGIAMGRRGTQVARDVSDMVLKDDAFPSIIKAVEQGRIIFENIKKFIIYQLSYHFAEIVIIAAISFTMFHLPLLPLQLLFLNLLSDVFPALALGVGKGSHHIMEKDPKDPEEPIITKHNWLVMGLYGVVISVYVIAAYVYAYHGMGLSPEACNNIAFFSLAFGQLLHVLDMREADEHVFINQVTRNKYIWMALGFCIVVLLIGYFVPVLSNALSFIELSPRAWGLILAATLLPLVTNQTIKIIWKI